MSMDLNELADRVEALAGPDRLIDATISATLRLEAMPVWAKTWAGEWRPEVDGRVTMMQADGNEGPNFLARAYTASIDAAMKLLDGHWLSLMTGNGAIAKIGRDGEWDYCASSEALSAPIAITAAALRTKALGAVHTLTEGCDGE